MAQIIQSGYPLNVVLLTEFPETNDPATWAKVPLQPNVTFTGVPVVLHDRNNTLATMQVIVQCSVVELCTCTCTGILFQGQCVGVAYVSPQQLEGDVDLLLNLQIQAAPWEH